MKSEIHLFIIWEKGRSQEKEIIDDIGKNLEILSIRYITWSEDFFSENLTRFYGQNLPSSSDKVKECGKGEFVLIVVRDNSPLYRPRKTTKGVKVVNVNIFDRKEMYRYWTGGGNKVHATNSELETNHDLTLLVGYNTCDFELRCVNSENKRIVEQRDLIGAKAWNSFGELLYTLNNCIEYVVLRNFEGLPENITIGEHGDVDFLTVDRKQFELIANSTPVSVYKFRVREIIKTVEGNIYCDIRNCGDDYYCKEWEKEILSKRVYNNRNFYVPDSINLFYSLLYHSLIHKIKISEDYIDKFEIYGKEFLHLSIDYEDREHLIRFLREYLIKNNYRIVEPKDLSVGFNIQNTNLQLSKSYRVRKMIYRFISKIVV
ncbi:hypothetical protein [Butyrivibrio sp. AE2032]|uniref:hypothetical protein n=1 Tax=Butyrivibrio sp. AE2032 TaxID=1458463 RepID=UPI00055603C6|nr:hypothetical protein [Butyrivibrio sp. AE2032]